MAFLSSSQIAEITNPATRRSAVQDRYKFVFAKTAENGDQTKRVLTETHAAEPLKYRQYDDPADGAFALDAEHKYHEDQHQSRLAAHDDELRDHVGEQNLAGRHARHPTSVQQTFHPFDDQRGWRQRDRQEKDDAGKRESAK